jgi:hypothetical protein
MARRTSIDLGIRRAIEGEAPSGRRVRRAPNSRLARLLVAALIIALAPAANTARSQFIGGGSTAQGDILRGEGVYLQGLGIGSYYSSMATSINVDTWIRLNEYIYQSMKQENRELLDKAALYQKRKRENYNKILERIKNTPERKDLERGDALNSVLGELLDPRRVHTSSLRFTPVNLNSNIARTIPFFRPDQGATISMHRLTAYGQWPPLLRDARFAPYRRAYERAFDEALEQQIEGKITPQAIEKVEIAVRDLRTQLPPRDDTLWREASTHLGRMENAVELLKHAEVEKVVGKLDKYHGATVEDLILFMRDNKLQFGVAESAEEIRVYTPLYAGLKAQLALVGGELPDPNAKP